MEPDSQEKIDKKRQSGLRTKSLFGALNASFLSSKGQNAVDLTVQNPPFIPKEEFRQQEQCHVCFSHFTSFFRRHHCRLCGKSVCSFCSGSKMNKEKICDICAYEYCNTQLNQKKAQIIRALKTLNKQMIGKKNEEELKQKNLESELSALKKTEQQDAADYARKHSQLTKQLENATSQRINLEATLQQVKSK